MTRQGRLRSSITGTAFLRRCGTIDERERLRRPPELDEEHVSMLTVARSLWKASYGAGRCAVAISMSPQEAEEVREAFLGRLGQLAAYQAKNGVPPDCPAGALAGWLFRNQDA